MSEPSRDLDLDLCAEAASACACFHFRKASRVVTQLFDDALEPTGLRSTQLVILLAVALFERSSVSRLAQELVMDRTTLTRNLRPLEKQRLLRIGSRGASRSRAVELTAEGKAAVRGALPVWRRTQADFVARIGDEAWGRLLAGLNSTVALSRGSIPA
jgi:DNA-binding MarR family transcriptional regulator